MSTFFNDIKAVLEQRAISIPGSPILIHENQEGSQDAGVEYVALDHQFGPTTQSTLGDNGRDLTDGIFQLSIYTPRTNGRSQLYDVISDHFKRGTYLTLNDVTLRIKSVSLLSGFSDENFFVVPISVDWQVFTAART